MAAGSVGGSEQGEPTCGTRVYDSANYREIARLHGSSYFTRKVVLSPDGKVLVSVGGKQNEHPSGTIGGVRIWDTDALRELRALSGHHQLVQDAAISPDGKTLVTVGSTDGRKSPDHHAVRVWELPGGRQRHSMSGHVAPDEHSPSRGLTPVIVNCTAFAPDGSCFATGGCDNLVRFWDATGEFKELGSLAGHTDFVLRVTFTPDNSRVISAGWDGTAIIWDRKTCRRLHTLRLGNKRQWAVDLALSPDGKTLATADQSSVRLWDVDTGGEMRTIPTTLIGPCCVAFSPDGRYLAIGFEGPFKLDPKGNVGGIEQWDLVADTQRVVLPR